MKNTFKEAFFHLKTFPKAFWVVVFSVFISQAGNMGFVFLVLYTTQYLKLSITKGAVTFLVFSLSSLIGGLIIGRKIDQFGAGLIMIASILLNGFILLVFSFAREYYQLIILCVLWGALYGMYRPASYTLITAFSKQGFHKITFSLYRLVSNLGMSIGPAIGGYLAIYSYKLIYIMNGLANILAGIILLVGLFNSQRLTNQSKKDVISSFTFIESMTANPAFFLFLMGMFLVSMVFFQHESTLSVYLKVNLHLPPSFYGWLFTINTLMIVFFELLLNITTLSLSYRINFILGGFFVTAGFAGMAFATTGENIIFLTIIWTIGEMILYPSSSSYVADISPDEKRGSYMSMYSTSSNMAMLFGPWGGAYIFQYLGGGALWFGCGICGLLSIIIFCTLKNETKKLQ